MCCQLMDYQSYSSFSEAAGLAKASGNPKRDKIGSVTTTQVMEIAREKMQDLNTKRIESAMKIIAGTARSMGITVQGEFPENIN